MKNLNFLAVLLVMSIALSCNDNNQANNKDRKLVKTDEDLTSIEEAIANFEKSYVEKYLSDKTDEVKLLGYKTMYLTGEGKEKFKQNYEHFKNVFDTTRGLFIAKDLSFYRVYFPMHTAIAEIDNKEYIANENGIINIPAQIQSKANSNSLNIIARVKSDKVTGCGSNIITNTKIIMNHKLTPILLNNNIYLFNMGDMDCCSTKASSTPCTQNHGSYRNCSDAFGIWGDNCVTRRDVCMDFNGPGSDCIKGPKWFFPVSDCQRAMARGHCWNEYM